MLQVVRHLRRGPDRKAAQLAGVRIELEARQRAVRLHRGVRNFVGDVAGLMHVVGVGETLVRIAEDVVIILLDIVGTVLVDEIGFRLHRLLGIEPRRQRLVIDIDQFERPLGGFFIDRRDARNVIADVAHFADCQRGLIVTDRKDAVSIRCVFAGHDRHHAFERFGARSVDALDAGVGIRRMQDLANQHARNFEVVRIFAGAGGFAGGVDHCDRFTDNGKVSHKLATSS